ncbi:MAG TPA: hypothetical protein VFY39_03935 [Gammaproteobacteria bacterium]|nr:hypothetical protein [Gammaproteobacteria bacterium]
MLFLIFFFVVIALAGAVLARYELGGREIPLPVGLLHGLAALAAIALLVVHDMHAPNNLLVNSATAVFVLAATGGLLLFLFRVQRQPVAGFVVTLHAGFALTAIVMLAIGYL